MSIPTFNANNFVQPDRYNRGLDNKYVEGVQQPVTVGLYTVDNAVLKYLQTKIKPVVTQQGKQVQVPVIYGNPERWKSAQQDGSIRDKNGMILLPIMMLRRTNMKKNTMNSPVNKYQNYVFKTGWNSRNAYDRFAVLNRVTPSQVYHSTIVPDFYDVTYEGMIWTEYMEQMNKLVENISFESDEYWGEDNNYKFITRINEFEQITDLPARSARLVRNKFSMSVRAYILPQSALDKNGNRVSTTRLEYSPKKVVFDTEIVSANGQIIKQTRRMPINPDLLAPNIELEDGANMLSEDGSYLLLEN